MKKKRLFASSESEDLIESSDGLESLSTIGLADYSVRQNDIIANRFQLLNEIGSGGCACVWQAYDMHLGNYIALKIQQGTSDQAIKMIRKEVLALRELPKDRYVSVYDYVEMGVPRIVGYTMELLHDPWQTLDVFRVNHNNLRTKYSKLSNSTKLLKTYLNIAIELLDSIGILHAKGYIHRDLKPNNLYINTKHVNALFKYEWNSDDIISVLKIGDLGLVTEAKNVEGWGGTRQFMAPEQNSYSEHNQSYKTDLFAIGKILYYLIVGDDLDKSYQGKSSKIGHLIKSTTKSSYLTKKISDIIAKLTNNDPIKRYSNALKAKRDILSIFDDDDQLMFYDAMCQLESSFNISEISDKLFVILKSYYGWPKISQGRRCELQCKVRKYQKSGLIKLVGHQYSLA